MANIGELTISPSAAHSAAHNIRTGATNIYDILTKIENEMKRIDDQESGLYEGTSKARDLKSELESIMTYFRPIYEKLNLYADEIDEAADAATNM